MDMHVDMYLNKERYLRRYKSDPECSLMCHNCLNNGCIVDADGDHGYKVIENVGKQDEGPLACPLEK